MVESIIHSNNLTKIYKNDTVAIVKKYWDDDCYSAAAAHDDDDDIGFSSGSGSLCIWLGADDVQREGTWRWQDGTYMTWNNWQKSSG